MPPSGGGQRQGVEARDKGKKGRDEEMKRRED
jgi:hypothetical protein